MDEARLLSRLMALPIPVAAAKRLFPGTPPGLLFEAAPFDGRSRFLPLRAAFDIARRHAEETAAEARATRALAARAADTEEGRAACAAPAFDLVAKVIDREIGALAESLRARDASPRAAKTLSDIASRCSRQIGRARSRIEKGGGDGRPS